MEEEKTTTLYLKPSGRFYYWGLVILFIILSTFLVLLAPYLPFNIYKVMFIIGVLFFIIGLLVMIYFQHHHIYVENNLITVKEGILLTKYNIIPFEKITDVKFTYSFIDKLLGVGTIMINTSGTSNYEVVMKYIPKEKLTQFKIIMNNFRKNKG